MGITRPGGAVRALAVGISVALLGACAAAPAIPPPAPTPVPTLNPLFAAGVGAAVAGVVASDVTVTVDLTRDQRPISRDVYGLNGPPADVLAELRTPFNSWGGNPSSRYNWRHGYAWNTARDWNYQNTDFQNLASNTALDFLVEARENDMGVRLAVPTLGWVAKNADAAICSFPNADGSCGNAGLASCENPGTIADPTRANVPSDTESVKAWLTYLTQERGERIQYIAMDNEPELWGVTHYDVHPECTTYREMRDKYIEYATAVRSVVPDAQLAGPTTCCWFYYWNSPSGRVDKFVNGNQEFLPWFLDELRKHDQVTGIKTIDVLDIHHYPADLYNNDADAKTAAHRLRSTKALYDPMYVDESWIATPIQLIPRMKTLIAQHYPGLKLGISEWNWGADKTMNGALAIADVLGIMGREGVDYATYWRYPDLGSPGMFAFKLFTNYDDNGGSFGGTAVFATSTNVDRVSSYAAADETTGRITVLLVNKSVSESSIVALQGAHMTGPAALFRYSQAAPDRIVESPLTLDPAQTLTLPPSSITLLVIERS